MTKQAETPNENKIRSKSDIPSDAPGKPKGLSDLRDELGLERTNYKIEALVGHEIVVQGLRGWAGRYGPCWTINFTLDGEPCFCVTSATVVTQKLEEVEAHLPLACTIIKEEEYYDIV